MFPLRMARLLLCFALTAAADLQRSAEEIQRRFDDDYPQQLKITADNLPLYKGGAYFTSNVESILQQIKQQIRPAVEAQVRLAAPAGIDPTAFDMLVERGVDAIWEARREEFRQKAEAGEFGNTTTFMADTFERDRGVPSHDNQEIVWIGCTEHSNIWDRATASAYKRADGSWGLHDFVIQFCSGPEGSTDSPYGTQKEQHIRATADGWVCTEHNQLHQPGDRAQGIKSVEGSAALLGEDSKITIADTARRATDSISHELPEALLQTISAFTRSSQDQTLYVQHAQNNMPQIRANGEAREGVDFEDILCGDLLDVTSHFAAAVATSAKPAPHIQQKSHTLRSGCAIL